MCDKNQHIWRVEGSGEGSDHPRIACVVCFLGRFNESAAPVWPWSTVYSADRIMNLPAIHSKLEKRFSWSQGWWYSWWKNSPRCTKFSFARFSRNLHHQTYHFVVFLVQPTCQLQVPSSLAKSCSIWPWWHAVFFNFFWSWQLVPIVCVLDAAFDVFFHSSKVSFPRSNQIVIVP